MDSILTSVKKVLGVPADFAAYDLDLILFINAALANLTQIGVGPEAGFQITGSTETWESFLADDPRQNNIKAYVVAKVRLMFDPPGTSFGIDALKTIAEEFEHRISVAREVAKWELDHS